MNLATLGIKVDTTDLKKTAPALDKVTKASGKTERATKGLTDSQGRLVASSKRAAAANQNLGKSSLVASKGLSAMKAGVLAAGVALTAFVTSSLGKFISGTSEAQDRQAQLAAAIASTGGAAGKSLEDLNAHATALQKITRYGDEVINSAQGVLLTFTNIKGDIFDRATESVLDMATSLKIDLKSASIQVGKALNDPVKGLSALSRSGITFSASQEAAIKQMVKLGDTAGAQTLMLKELETQFGGSAKAARDTLGGAIDAVRNNFGDLFELSGVGVDYLQGAFERLAEVFGHPAFVGLVNILGNLLLGAIGLLSDALSAIIGSFNMLIEVIGWMGRTGKQAFVDLATFAGVSSEDMAAGWEFVKDAAKDAFNSIIGIGVGSYKFIVAEWGNLPAAFADISIQGANSLIKWMKYGANEVIGIYADMINSINSTLGTSLSKPGMIQGDYSIPNPFEGSSNAGKKAFNEAMSKDYLGEVKELNSSIAKTTALAQSAGGALGAAANDNVDPWKGMRKAVDATNESLDFAKDITKGFISDLQSGLKNGEGFWKSFANAGVNALQKIFDKALDKTLDNLFSGSGASGGGLFGGLFGGIGKILGFAKGTNYAPGGVSLVGEEGPELVELPRGSKVNTANQTRRMMSASNNNASNNNSQNVHVTVGVSTDGNGNIKPFVESVVQGGIQQAAPSIVSGSVKAVNSQMPNLIANYQKRSG